MLATPVSRFLLDVLSLVLIDLVLAGDNALVIAMAVRGLPRHQRRLGSVLGASLAVALRAGLTIIAAKLIGIEFLKLVGGAFVIWIAIKVLTDASSPPPASGTPKRLMQVVFAILVADLTMSTDNILAIAGASHGNTLLIILGLCISIPFLVLSSNLLTALMDRYPAILYVGAAVLGNVGAEMMLTDPVVVRTLAPSRTLLYSAQAGAAAAVLIVGWLLSRRMRQEEARRRTQREHSHTS